MVNKQLLINSVKNTSLSPEDRIQGIRQSGAVLLEYIGGSHAYGTSTPSSDKDLRGVFCMPIEEYAGLTSALPKGCISDDRELDGQKAKNDDMFYTLRRFFELLKGANPNVIESLWMPSDCIVTMSPEMETVIAHRHLFVSKACLGSHFGYAQAQISKARGKNKKVHNPCPKERPKKVDFCRIIACIPGTKPWTNPDVPSASHFPFRPVPLNDMPWIDLKDYHVAAVEHMANAYRLYCYYGDESCRGVFRGDDMLVCESIPKEDEHARFSGILLYNKEEYEKAIKDWKSYWDWVKNRNETRWINQESGQLTFDQKNMMHCVRLLWSGLNLVRHGEPIVRFSGDKLDYLMALRTGKITDYDAVMALVNSLVKEMEEAAITSTIPESVDQNAIEALYAKVSQAAWKRLF